MEEYLNISDFKWNEKVQNLFEYAGTFQKRLVDFAPDINHPEYPFRDSNAWVGSYITNLKYPKHETVGLAEMILNLGKRKLWIYSWKYEICQNNKVNGITRKRKWIRTFYLSIHVDSI